MKTNLEHCLSCSKHLPKSKFPLTVGPARKCLNCERLESKARKQHDLDVFKNIWEEVKRNEEESGNKTSPIFNMQPTDVRYLVLFVWSSQSLLSGKDDIRNLTFARWNIYVEWAPWNCILLTNDEAKLHMEFEDPKKVISDIKNIFT